MEANQGKVSTLPAKGSGRLFRTKPLDSILADAEKPEYQLKRALGPVQLTLIGIGAIIGAGIFLTIGTAAAGDANRPGAGPSLILAFVVTAIVCGFTALCYAEFASMVPISGSAYTYSYATLGEVIAWIIGWDLIIEYAIGNVGVAISWAKYFKTFVAGFHVQIPGWLSTDYASGIKDAKIYASAPKLLGDPNHPIIINLLAVAIVAVITVVLVWGVRESARFNAVMVGIKILVLTFFIMVGLLWVKPANWTPFAPNGWAGMSAGAAVVFFAYIGFDAVSTVAEETKNPKRDLPVGIIASLIICTIFYVAVAVVFTGLISYPDLVATSKSSQAEPLTLAVQYAIPNSGWIVGIVAFGSVMAHTAVLLVFQLGQPRIFFSMSRDGLLPPVFASIHPRFRTPYFSTILTGVFVGSIAAFADISEMVDLTNIGTLFAFILVCAGIIVLRCKEPHRPRPFRVPGGWLLPALGILSCLYLIYYLPPTSWLRFAAWLNFGFVIYIGYGSVHSRLTGTAQSDQPAEHGAYTARVGAWLALIGAALLLFMRGFDVWLGAMKRPEQAWLAKAAAGWREVFSLAPWLEISWFLIIPLALNAFVLCPIVIRRSLRAWREKGLPARGRLLTPSLFVAAALPILTVLYFALITAHQVALG